MMSFLTANLHCSLWGMILLACFKIETAEALWKKGLQVFLFCVVSSSKAVGLQWAVKEIHTLKIYPCVVRLRKHQKNSFAFM